MVTITHSGFNPADLDPGIRDLVVYLRSCGFETTDSGDGVSKPDDERVFQVPHIVARIHKSDMVCLLYTSDAADEL